MPDSLKGVNSRLVKLALSLQQQFLRADTVELTLGLCTVPQFQTMCIYALDALDKNAPRPSSDCSAPSHRDTINSIHDLSLRVSPSPQSSSESLTLL